MKRALYAMRLMDAHKQRVAKRSRLWRTYPQPWQMPLNIGCDIWVRCGTSDNTPDSIRRFITWG